MLGKRIINTATGAGAACTTDTVQILGDTSCVAYYKMSDATDETGSYDGTHTNVNFNVAGKFGNAGEFNGSSSYIDLGSASSLVSTDFTFSAWVRTTSTSNIFLVASPVNPYYSKVGIRSEGDGRLRCAYGNYTSNENLFYSTFSTINDGDWHHVVYFINQTTAKLYVDGSLDTTHTLTVTPSTNGTLNIGSIYSDSASLRSSYWDGQIDQIRIFDRAITANEVTTLYNEVYCQPTIVPTNHFNTVLYTGTGSGSKSVTGVGFQPDLVWGKSRNDTISHILFDVVRGENKQLSSNTTGAEVTRASAAYEFDSDGFTVTTVGNLNNAVNYVAWNWKAGGAAVTNTDGTITSQVSANVDAGFSIVTFDGNQVVGETVAHGLNSAPELVIIKRRSTTNNWLVMDSNIGQGGYLDLTLNFSASNYNFWTNFTSPNDSVVTLGGYSYTNGTDMLMYCFHSVDGMSKIGSYVGTGASGNSIVTGFRPAFVMIKRTSASGSSWAIFDNKRGVGEPSKVLYANLSDSEYSDNLNDIEFSSNGFTLLDNNEHTNYSSNTYIFMAFAEENVEPQPVLANSFNTVTYTGNGTTQAINTVGFQPDLVWIKDRTSANSHILQDSVRGANKALLSNATSAEITSTDFFTSFDSNGFTLPSNTGEQTNKLNNNYVAWCWKASNESTINQEGSITSILSANPAAGFSIVKYTTPTTNNFSIGHGLSSTPELVFFKGLNQADNWITYASTTGATKYLRLNGTDAATTSSLPFNDTSPTSTVINLGSATTFWGTSIDTIAYCFHSVAGYQKVGSYSGNGTDLSITGLGFQPSFLMLKRTDSTSNWVVFDSVRGEDEELYPNLSNAESNEPNRTSLDSDGFTVRSGRYNNSGSTFIYLAIKAN